MPLESHLMRRKAAARKAAVSLSAENKPDAPEEIPADDKPEVKEEIPADHGSVLPV